MDTRTVIKKLMANFFVMMAAAVCSLSAQAPAYAGQAGQASLELNCNNALCYVNTTQWGLLTNTTSQTPVVASNSTVTWDVIATKNGASDNFIRVNGVVTVTNTGSAPATIGNIVVNLQKPSTGANTGACRNIPWVSAAANVADATNGDNANSAKIVAAGSAENVGCNAAQGPGNYVVSDAQGTFTETAASGRLEFTDASDNSVFHLTPQVSLAPNQSLTLLYTASFNNTELGLAVGSSVRAETLVTFGNAGARGGSGASARNIDISGNGLVDTDEANVRTVPCRVGSNVPALLAGNASLTLSDAQSAVSVSPVDTGVSIGNFIGFGAFLVNDTTTLNVSVDQTCTPPGSARITNTAYLVGEGLSVTLQHNSQSYEFACVRGVDLRSADNALVSCDRPARDGFANGDFCSYSTAGYGAPGAETPDLLILNNFTTVFAGGLTIGVGDGAGLKHNATWSGDALGLNAILTYLAGAGTPGVLTADTFNATSVSGGTLAKQTAALTLNVEFEAAGVSGGTDPANFGELQLCNLVEGTQIGGPFLLNAAQAAALNGISMSQLLTDANKALGGDGLPAYVGTFVELNQLVSRLNQSFDSCRVSEFASDYICRP